MKYNVYYGQPPFEHLLGFVEAPHDRPVEALLKAKKQFIGVVPKEASLVRGCFYEQYPVVEKANV